jgi:hypothetical protein
LKRGVEVGFRRRTNEGKEHEKKESGRRKERERGEGRGELAFEKIARIGSERDGEESIAR